MRASVHVCRCLCVSARMDDCVYVCLHVHLCVHELVSVSAPVCPQTTAQLRASEGCVCVHLCVLVRVKSACA